MTVCKPCKQYILVATVAEDILTKLSDKCLYEQAKLNDTSFCYFYAKFYCCNDCAIPLSLPSRLIWLYWLSIAKWMTSFYNHDVACVAMLNNGEYFVAVGIRGTIARNLRPWKLFDFCMADYTFSDTYWLTLAKAAVQNNMPVLHMFNIEQYGFGSCTLGGWCILHLLCTIAECRINNHYEYSAECRSITSAREKVTDL